MKPNGAFVATLFLLAAQLFSSALAKQSSPPREPALKQELPPIPFSTLPANSIHIPLFRQSTFYTCGVASLQACLNYWQVYDSTEEVLAEECGSTEDQGTQPQNIVKVAQSYNLTAYMKENCNLDDLEKAIAGGWTVILDVQAWTEEEGEIDWKNDWEDGHYVVLVGLDSRNLYIMDPSTGARYAYMPIPEFLDRWHDYELNADGSRREYKQLGIFIKGETPIETPASITYMA